MARIDASITIDGDEPVSFHETGGRMVMLIGPAAIGVVFPDADTARTWLAVTHGRLMEWQQAQHPLPEDEVG